MALGATVMIGKMRNRVVFERRSMAQDALGGQSETWSPVATMWVSIEALTGRELQAAQAVRVADTHTVICRHIAGLSAKDRFRYTDADGILHTYNLTDVIDIEMKHRFQQCTAEEGLAPG